MHRQLTVVVHIIGNILHLIIYSVFDTKWVWLHSCQNWYSVLFCWIYAFHYLLF